MGTHYPLSHPELKDQKGRALETLEEPDFVQEGDFGSLLAIRFYQDTPISSKFLTVVYREVSINDGFILTAYFTNKPLEKRKVLWKR